MKAVLMDLRNPSEPRLLGTFYLREDGTAHMVTNRTKLREDIMVEGIYGKGGRHYTMDDGKEFIENLPHHFNGTYMRAKVFK